MLPTQTYDQKQVFFPLPTVTENRLVVESPDDSISTFAITMFPETPPIDFFDKDVIGLR